MLNRLPDYIKPTVFQSSVLGAVLGVLLLIPIVNFLTIFIFWLAGALIVISLKYNKLAGHLENREGIVIGSISGMLTVVVASLVFIPLSVITGLIFKTASIAGFLTASFVNSVFSLFVLFIFVLFIGLMNIVFTIASALLAIYIINSYIEPKEEEEIAEFKIDL
ncbi:MAG: hypothetical protein PHX18_07405 [Candidatus Gastranaerophilales bacterium]|nr:hypothetical protein [Candidatus Gastranaerophilales bacterium]